MGCPQVTKNARKELNLVVLSMVESSIQINISIGHVTSILESIEDYKQDGILEKIMSAHTRP